MPGHDGVYCIVSDGKLDCSIQGLNKLSPLGTKKKFYTGSRLRPRGPASYPFIYHFWQKWYPFAYAAVKVTRQWKSTLSLASGSCYGKSRQEFSMKTAFCIFDRSLFIRVIWAIFQLPCDHFPCFVFVFTHPLTQRLRSPWSAVGKQHAQ